MAFFPRATFLVSSGNNIVASQLLDGNVTSRNQDRSPNDLGLGLDIRHL